MALKTSIFAILCTVAATATTVNAAPSVRSVGGSGAFSGTTAATNATGNAQRAGSLRVSGVVRPVAKVTKSGITTFDEKGNATTVSRAASAPRLSIGKYLGVPKGQSISMDAVPNQLTNQISNIEGDIVDIRGILQYIQETMAEHHTVYIEFVPDPEHQDTDSVLQWYYTDEENPEIHRLFSTYDLRGLGDPVQLRATDEYFQWKYESETDEAWRNLAPVPQDGEDGQDGREVVLHASETHLQWKYDGQSDSAYQNLIELSSLNGVSPTIVKDDCNTHVPDDDPLRGEAGQCIQWYYTDVQDGRHNIVTLAALTGADGANGQAGATGANAMMTRGPCSSVDENYDLHNVAGDCIQWYPSTNSNDLHNLIAISSLPAGPAGANGADGDDGTDGREIAMGTALCSTGATPENGVNLTGETGNCFQWHYTSGDQTWYNLAVVPVGGSGSGTPGTDGREIALGTALCSTGATPENGVNLTGETGNCFQWHYTSGDQTWYNLSVVPANGADGADGQDGQSVDMQVSACGTAMATGCSDPSDPNTCKCVQWKLNNATTWNDLIRTEDLRGPAGANGADGADGADGQDGREIELRVKQLGASETACAEAGDATADDYCLQWHYTSGSDQAWRGLINLSTMSGGNSGRTTVVNVQSCGEATGAKRKGLDETRQCLAWAYSDEANSDVQTTRANAWTNLHYADFGALAFKDTVDTIDIEDDAVTTDKIADGNVTKPKLSQELQTILEALETDSEMGENQYVLGINKENNGSYSYEWKKVQEAN